MAFFTILISFLQKQGRYTSTMPDTPHSVLNAHFVSETWASPADSVHLEGRICFAFYSSRPSPGGGAPPLPCSLTFPGTPSLSITL